LKRGDEALEGVGFPLCHREPILRAANTLNSVILSRAVGKVCQMLIEQGYDMKDFRIHAKSCNWGPMAGFVLRDPRLSKQGILGQFYNRKAHKQSLHPTKEKEVKANFVAKTAPIFISEQRRAWLQDNGLLGICQAYGDRFYHGEVSNEGVTLRYSLIKELIPVTHGGKTFTMWGLYLDRLRYADHEWPWQEVGECPRVFYKWPDDGGPDANTVSTRYEAVLGMVNAFVDLPGIFSPVTGDYDLFGVWPHKSVLDIKRVDRRLSPTRTNLDTFIAEDNSSIGYRMGNYTLRVRGAGYNINTYVGQVAKLPNRKCVHHSDEAGRPGIDDVDLPLIGFIPQLDAFYIDTVRDLEVFLLASIQKGYVPEYNKAWFRQLFGKLHNYRTKSQGGTVDDLLRTAPKAPRRMERVALLRAATATKP
jgi:hypothetical protein